MLEDEEQLHHPTNGATTAIGFNLPESIIAVLPSDPFEQLDLARKITSIALATRLANLEDEIDDLRRTVADRDDLVANLHTRIESFDSTLGELSSQLTRAQEEKVGRANFSDFNSSRFWPFRELRLFQEALLKENDKLSETIKKLNRDVSKVRSLLCCFRLIPRCTVYSKSTFNKFKSLDLAKGCQNLTHPYNSTQKFQFRLTKTSFRSVLD